MRFTTGSGSEYEVKYNDGTGVQVRRLSGPGKPTERQGEDVVWKGALAVYPQEPEVGKPVLIHWKMNENGSMNCTQTSPVAKVEF